MYEKTTYDVLLKRMLGRVSDKFDKRPSSLIYDTSSAAALELEILYIELEYLILNSFGDTAAREFLILLCKDRGIIPDPASKAVLKGKFVPDTVDVTGQMFFIGNVKYIVTEMISAGEYQVVCETPGSIGNRYLGSMIPAESIDGLESAGLTELLIPGDEEEETEHLRQRYLNSFKSQEFGGNRLEYLNKVKAIDGVGDVKITRTWNSSIRPADMVPTEEVAAWYNSVKPELPPEAAKWLSGIYTAAAEKKLTAGGAVLITAVESESYKPATEVLLDRIQTELDPPEYAGEGYGLAPIGHVVRVQSAEEVKVNISVTITFKTSYSWINRQEVINKAVEDYLLELRKLWGESRYLVVRLSQLESRILALEGILDVANTTINGEAGNLTLGEYEVPVIGGVTP